MFEQVGQRQPHGANLQPARREAVDHAARDNQVPARIVVAQRQAGAKIHDRGQNPHTAANAPILRARGLRGGSAIISTGGSVMSGA